MSDDGDFEKRFRKLTTQTLPEVVVKGMGRAGLAIMRDAVMEEPKVPLDLSSLRGSGSTFVGAQLVGTSESFAEAQAEPTPNKEFSAHTANGEVVTTVGFNTPYAANLHEHPEYDFGVTRENQGLPRPVGTGAKFLESKLLRFRKRYMTVVAKWIERATGVGMQQG